MKRLRIGIVGPCAAGKSTLIAGLKEHGFTAKHIAQEHSYVPAMWQIITNPDLLIFLDVSYELSVRRKNLNWTLQEYEEQQNRLRHARQHASLVIETDPLSPPEVLDQVLGFLEKSSQQVE